MPRHIQSFSTVPQLAIAFLAVFVSAMPLVGQTPGPSPTPAMLPAVFQGVSATLANMVNQSSETNPESELSSEPDTGFRFQLPPGMKVDSTPDAVLQGSAVQAASDVATIAISSFDGQGVGKIGPFPVNFAPPDTNGAVGPNNYVQWVNTDIAIFDKNGNLQLGPFPGNVVWTGSGTPCAVTNDGDPIVLYDKLANRWVLSQFSIAANEHCVAVSTSADPTGSYYLYTIQYAALPDYPKMGVWPDAYYVTSNLFSQGTTFTNASLCAYDRVAMLNGESISIVPCFQPQDTLGNPLFGALPADMDGTTPPPTGSPNYMLALGANSLTLFKFHFNRSSPTLSTLTGPISIPVQPFTPAESSFTTLCPSGQPRITDCIPQDASPVLLDALGDRLMYRLAYRNFGSHESLVVNHTVSAGGKAGVRWYEIQNPNGTPTVAQQGTFAPDSNFRWLGSVAMDRMSNILMGYSVSGNSMNPAIAVTGRAATDTLGKLQAETQILVSGSSQTDTDRWGDYSAMMVDPVDDCTFWYTTEYESTNNVLTSFHWSTRVAKFIFPFCTSDFSLSPSPSALAATPAATVSSTITVNPIAGFSGSVSLSAPALPPGVTASFNPQVTATTSTVTFTFASNVAAGTVPVVITGSSGVLSRSTILTLNITAAPVGMLQPGNLAFSGTNVGSSSAGQTVTLSNIGTATMSVQGITTNSGDFTESNKCPATLAVGASCQIGVTFTPEASGTLGGSLVVNSNAINSPETVSLNGEGLIPPAVLSSITPSQVTAGSTAFTLLVNGPGNIQDFFFGAVVSVNGSPRTTTFVNSNQLQIGITASDVESPGQLTIVVTNPAPGGGASTSLPLAIVTAPIPLVSNLAPPRAVVCNPASAACSSLTLIVNGSFFPADSVVQLGGSNRPTTFISSSQLTAAIPATDLVASGFAPITITSVSARASANSVPLIIFRYGDINFDNVISTSDLVTLANFLAGNISIADPGPADLNLDGKIDSLDLIDLANFLAHNVQSLPVTSNQTAFLFNAGAVVALSPPTFAGQAVGTTSSSLPILLTNGGASPLSIASIVTSAEFNQTNNCGTSLAGNASCTIQLTFTPAAAGTRSGTLTIEDGATNSPQIAALSGLGISPPTATLSIAGSGTDSVSTLTFVSQPVGSDGVSRSLTLTNLGPSSLAVSGINVAPGSDFGESDNCSGSLAPNTSCTILVTFSPVAVGLRTAMLTVTSNATNSPQSVNLSGQGSSGAGGGSVQGISPGSDN